MDKEYQILLDQLLFDQTAYGFEFRYKCGDFDLGFRAVITDQDEMSLFDVPFMKIDRPSVFNINDFWPEKTIQQFIELLVTSAYEMEKEALIDMKPDDFYHDIHQYAKVGHSFLGALDDGIDMPDSGTKLFTILTALITLLIRTDLNTDKSSGIGILSETSCNKH